MLKGDVYIPSIDQHVIQPHTSGDHNISQRQKATVEVENRFLAAVIIMKTSLSVVSDEMLLRVAEV